MSDPGHALRPAAMRQAVALITAKLHASREIEDTGRRDQATNVGWGDLTTMVSGLVDGPVINVDEIREVLLSLASIAAALMELLSESVGEDPVEQWAELVTKWPSLHD